MLGYCQEMTYGKHQGRRAEQIRRVFWCIFTVDMNMSLLQGRPSYLRSCEVDAWLPRISPDAAFKGWDELFVLGIKFAKLQSRIYDQLYAADARHVPRVQQVQLVDQLSVELQSWYSELGGASSPSFLSLPFQ